MLRYSQNQDQKPEQTLYPKVIKLKVDPNPNSACLQDVNKRIGVRLAMNPIESIDIFIPATIYFHDDSLRDNRYLDKYLLEFATKMNVDEIVAKEVKKWEDEINADGGQFSDLMQEYYEDVAEKFMTRNEVAGMPVPFMVIDNGRDSYGLGIIYNTHDMLKAQLRKRIEDGITVDTLSLLLRKTFTLLKSQLLLLLDRRQEQAKESQAEVKAQASASATRSGELAAEAQKAMAHLHITTHSVSVDELAALDDAIKSAQGDESKSDVTATRTAEATHGVASASAKADVTTEPQTTAKSVIATPVAEKADPFAGSTPAAKQKTVMVKRVKQSSSHSRLAGMGAAFFAAFTQGKPSDATQPQQGTLRGRAPGK